LVVHTEVVGSRQYPMRHTLPWLHCASLEQRVAQVALTQS
jgi:hypothetical protein